MALSFNDENSLFNFVVKDGNGVKGLVDSGLTQVPGQYIQPPIHRINKQNTTVSLENMIIDLSELDGPNHDQVVKSIAHAAETPGFFQVVNHGVPIELLESLKVSAHEFFNQPSEKKAVYLKGVSPSPMVKYGTSFVPEKEKALEWKDYISMIYTNDADALEFWPNECKEVALEYIKTSTGMSKTRTPSPSLSDENLSDSVASVGREGNLGQSGRVVDDVQDDQLEQILYPGTSQQPAEPSSATPLDENVNSEGNAIP
ncbi:2-oxoglutarate (2OG) and Fe(II)-dependent oxygenase superfamily protein [Artemisia annua]|uniref:2-oxoglutarate (2OG) and Fe(II)-dependent oxygenase superfamily protein n=1 Tax=Artemisia annua TaxID=35608 RepID=A0A2U1PUR6_ARTAN|nr:2-oxoglutarate (2OG) and Fe(II)-dependent oxygenase superfamily protein [Artemisia annua]